MDSKNPDEILCSSCGRPNLIEAEKCWYCQIPLTKEKNLDEPVAEESETHTDNNQEPVQEVKEKFPNPDEDIPEWLKRVRELKEQDGEINGSSKDQWQQQDFFDSSKEKPGAKPIRKPRKKTDSTAHKKHEKTDESDRPIPQPILDISKQSEVKEEKKQTVNYKKHEIEDTSEELPDGFIEFHSEND